MICTQCGKNNVSGVNYCAYCGGRIYQPGEARAPQPQPQPYYGPPASMHRPANSALIAVLIVIAVIIMGGMALMMRAMVGVAGQSRLRARQTYCLSNVKQLGLGMLMYTQDYDMHFPRKQAWSDGIYPYVKNNSIYLCPDLPAAGSSYSYNAQMDRKPLAKVLYPAQTVMLFESGAGWNASGGRETVRAGHQGDGGPQATTGFTDGHVKIIEASALKSGQAFFWDPTGALR